MAWLQKLQRKDGSYSYKAYWRDPGFPVVEKDVEEAIRVSAD